MFIENVSDFTYVVADGIQRGPVRRNVGRQSSSDGIDTEGEQAVKSGMDTFQAVRGALCQTSGEQIPVECFQMPDIKDDAMPLRNGPLVKRFGANQIKESITAASSI